MQVFAQQIDLRPVNQLTGYEGNAKKHSARQVAKIAASIAEFGFNAPILVDSNGVIVAGHGRYAAALQLGLEQVPVVVLSHLTDAQRKAYTIADNRLAEDGTWDMGKLATEVQQLMADGFDATLTGLDQVDMTRLDMEMRRAAAELAAMTTAAPPLDVLPAAYTPAQAATPAVQAQQPQTVTTIGDVPQQQPAAAPAPAPVQAAPSMPAMVPFNAMLTVTQRDLVLAVLNRVKSENGLPTIGEALVTICQLFAK